MQLLSVGPYTFASTGDLLLLQLGSGQSEAIQSAALATLGRFDDPRIAPALIQRWRVLTPRLRSDAFTALLARTDRVAAVLAALESGAVGGADLSSAQVNFLRTHRDPAISQRALQLFGPVPRQRPEAVQRFKPALGLKGVPARGREIFLARCAACHQPRRRDARRSAPTWPAPESTAKKESSRPSWSRMLKCGAITSPMWSRRRRASP